jgi:hypothetical protein
MPCEANFGVMIGLESTDVYLGYAASLCLLGIHGRKLPIGRHGKDHQP